MSAATAAQRRGSLRRTLELIRPHLGQHKALLIIGLVTMLAEVALRVLEPWPVKFVIDAVSVSLGATGGAASGIQEASIGLLVSCGVLLLGIVMTRAFVQYCSTVAFALAGSKIATRVRSRVFHHLQSLAIRYHATARAGDTVQRLVGDVGRLQEVAVTAGLPLVGNLITLVVLAVVMWFLDPLLMLVVAAAAALYVLISRRGARRITTAARKTRKSEGNLANLAAETLGAIRVVQAFGLERERGHVFERGNDKALTDGVESRRLAAGLERRTDVIVGLALAAVLVGGGWRVVEGAMTPGDLVVFTMYIKIALRPLKDLAKHTGRIARATASGERIADLLDEEVEVADGPWSRPLGRVRGDIAFSGVSVNDGYGRPLFQGIDLQVRAGTTVCVLGPSGAGKSTLAGLLTRTADPAAGSIAIDGLDIRYATLESLRANVAVVLQDSVLFAESVRENIRLGRLDATDAEVEQAARRALAHDFVVDLPEGYDTVLGGRGDTLSGGQRQRIAIARAFLRDAPIIVLDEATTGLDPASKATVEASIEELTAHRTTIAVTHDPGAIRAADRILWIDQGCIVEDGTPDELLARPDSQVARWMRTAQAANTVAP